MGGPIVPDKTFFHAVFETDKVRQGLTIVSRTLPREAKVDGGSVPPIDPRIKPLLTLFPDPNLPNNEFTFPFSQPTNEYFGQIRGDHTFSANDTGFIRYTADSTNQVRVRPFPQFVTPRESRSQFATLSESHVFSPSVLNTFRYSFSRTVLLNRDASGIRVRSSRSCRTSLSVVSRSPGSPRLGRRSRTTPWCKMSLR